MTDQEMIDLALRYLHQLDEEVGLVHPLQLLGRVVDLYNKRKEEGLEQ